MTTTARTATFDVAALRRAEYPWTDEVVYLNSASIGPLPERTRLALEEFNRARSRPHLLSDPMLFAGLDEARALVGRLINADPAEIALSVNTTWGLNLAAMGLPLERGDIVLLSDREFPANVYPWLRLEERGVTVELAPTTPEGWPDEDRLLERLRDPRVRVLAVSLVQFSNGWLADLAKLGAAARTNGAWVVVDAIQGVGQVPVDVQSLPVDVLACGGQKWLLSPWGSGFTYVRRDLIERLEPPVVSWMAFAGTDDFTRLTEYDPALRPDARRYEFITLPYQDIAGMSRSLELILELGVERIQAHLASLRAPLLEWARERDVRITSPTDHHASGIVCLAPPDAAGAFRALRAAGIVASLREGSIRLSPHAFNTPDDIARVMDVLDGR
ncbi:MAG: aminotransferase class V-fold PLP-dependent enzyme [Gemmatimonadota bacterium]|nr:aminotransferase class V-fold PLP-dependent enzyme [Gemmatimonadota bacterium]